MPIDYSKWDNIDYDESSSSSDDVEVETNLRQKENVKKTIDMESKEASFNRITSPSENTTELFHNNNTKKEEIILAADHVVMEDKKTSLEGILDKLFWGPETQCHVPPDPLKKHRDFVPLGQCLNF